MINVEVAFNVGPDGMHTCRVGSDWHLLHTNAWCMQELMRVHAREVSHLEYIVSGKALAGKCSVVRDSTFQRVASVPML